MELPPEVQAQLVQGMGGQVSPDTMQHLEEQQALQDVNDVSVAADSAHNIMSDGTEEVKPEAQGASHPTPKSVQ
jgi:hypothetical protein